VKKKVLNLPGRERRSPGFVDGGRIYLGRRQVPAVGHGALENHAARKGLSFSLILN